MYCKTVNAASVFLQEPKYHVLENDNEKDSTGTKDKSDVVVSASGDAHQGSAQITPTMLKMAPSLLINMIQNSACSEDRTDNYSNIVSPRFT